MIALQYHHKAAEGPARAGRARERAASAGARSAAVPALLALVRPCRADRARHLAARAQGLEGSADRDADAAARRAAGRAAAAATLGRASTPADDEFRRVDVPRRVSRTATEALVYTSGSALRDDVKSARAISCSRRRGSPDGSIVVVNRGYRAGRPRIRTAPVPTGARSRSSAYLRWPEAPSLVRRRRTMPRDDLWFVRDHRGDGRAPRAGATVAPFYVEQEAPVPPGGLPQPGRLKVQPAATTTCNTRSPGTGWRWCWRWCLRSGRSSVGRRPRRGQQAAADWRPCDAAGYPTRFSCVPVRLRIRA